MNMLAVLEEAVASGENRVCMGYEMLKFTLFTLGCLS